jgi:glycerophosphoryl diester phosphodiesterase
MRGRARGISSIRSSILVNPRKTGLQPCQKYTVQFNLEGQGMKFIKRLCYFAVVLIPLIYAFCIHKNSTVQQMLRAPEKRVLVIAHRGASGLLPENTMTSFVKACEIGVDALECDVQCTEDGELVVYHNPHLNYRNTKSQNGKYLKKSSKLLIKDLSVSELKTYDVGYMRPKYRDSNSLPMQKGNYAEKIPTLSELISYIKKNSNKKLELWIEIKTNPEKTELTYTAEIITEKVLKLLQDENMLNRVRILSFDWSNLIYVQKNAADIPTVYLSAKQTQTQTQKEKQKRKKEFDNLQLNKKGASPWLAGFDADDFKGAVPAIVQQAGGRFWAINQEKARKESVDQAHKLGIQVFAWSANTREEMERLIDMGVDGIITNRPDVLVELLAEKRKGWW